MLLCESSYQCDRIIGRYSFGKNVAKLLIALHSGPLTIPLECAVIKYRDECRG